LRLSRPVDGVNRENIAAGLPMDLPEKSKSLTLATLPDLLAGYHRDAFDPEAVAKLRFIRIGRRDKIQDCRVSGHAIEYTRTGNS